MGREKRRIRNNLPLKNVLVVAAKEEHIEALTYLRAYFTAEINAWDVTMSTEWEKVCALTVKPNFQALGKRCGKQMKDVGKAIGALAQEDLVSFMHSGAITVMGFELTTDDLLVKREFTGDAKRYEACVSDDGSLLIAIDTTCDEEMLQELRARTLAATVQKMRKSAGLILGDKVEIFYDDGCDPLTSPIALALSKHGLSTVKRLKTMPLPANLKPTSVIVIAREVVTDAELSKTPVTIWLTQPLVAVDVGAVQSLLSGENAALSASSVVMFLQTMDNDTVLSQASFEIEIDGSKVVVVRDTHYFATAFDMLLSGREALKAAYPPYTL